MTVKNIMFIDDDPEYIQIILHCIKKLDNECHVTTALNGQIAIDLLETLVKESRELPSIIFIDANMPVMDGFEFVRALLQLSETLPVLKTIKQIAMLTSSNDHIDRESAKGLGINQYIIKPCGVANTLKTLKEFIQ